MAGSSPAAQNQHPKGSPTGESFSIFSLTFELFNDCCWPIADFGFRNTMCSRSSNLRISLFIRKRSPTLSPHFNCHQVSLGMFIGIKI